MYLLRYDPRSCLLPASIRLVDSANLHKTTLLRAVRRTRTNKTFLSSNYLVVIIETTRLSFGYRIERSDGCRRDRRNGRPTCPSKLPRVSQELPEIPQRNKR